MCGLINLTNLQKSFSTQFKRCLKDQDRISEIRDLFTLKDFGGGVRVVLSSPLYC